MRSFGKGIVGGAIGFVVAFYLFMCYVSYHDERRHCKCGEDKACVCLDYMNSCPCSCVEHSDCRVTSCPNRQLPAHNGEGCKCEPSKAGDKIVPLTAKDCQKCHGGRCLREGGHCAYGCSCDGSGSCCQECFLP